MEEENYNNIDEIENPQHQSLKERRGTFLTVLCILSWATSGFTFFNSLSTLFKGKKALQNEILIIEEKLEMTDNGFFYDFFQGLIDQFYIIFENFYGIYISSFLISAVGIFSIYLMFNLNKKGFYLYLVYAFLSPLVAYYFFKDSTSLITGLIISIVFVIMYKANLKRMTN